MDMNLSLSPWDKYLDWICVWTNYTHGTCIPTKGKVTAEKRRCDALDVWQFAQNIIMVLKSGYVRRLDLQHTGRMGCILTKFWLGNLEGRGWLGVSWGKFQVDIKQIPCEGLECIWLRQNAYACSEWPFSSRAYSRSSLFWDPVWQVRNWLPTFRDNISGPISTVKQLKSNVGNRWIHEYVGQGGNVD
jgi:hypothetical protein